ncbi:MAG TPA: MlaD family protein [Thermodesulfobacteriota bacterium]|nr:MlaD family protein [Thermodesulfobacteriota bacterium]
MSQVTTEAKVGIFVVIGIVILTYMTLTVGQYKFGKEKGYTIKVRFKSMAGVDLKSPVKIAGVEIGKVEDIRLSDNMAELTLRIADGIKIPEDSEAVVRGTGLMGEKHIEIVPGSPQARRLKRGEEIVKTSSPTDMDQLFSQLSDVITDIKGVTSSMNKVLGGEEGRESLKTIIDNIRDISENLNMAFTENKLGRMIENFEAFSQDMREISSQNRDALNQTIANLEEFSTVLKDRTPEISDSLKLAADNLSDILKENRGNLKDTVENIKTASNKLQDTLDAITNVSKKIEKGEGTVGRLINEDTTYDKLNSTLTGLDNYFSKVQSFKFFIDYRGEYLTRREETKSYLNLRIQPKPDKYYLLGIVDDPEGFQKDTDTITTTNGITTTTHEDKTTDRLKFNVQIAKRYYDLTVRGGIVESTGGVGADYHLFRDRVKLSLDAWDFNREPTPRLKASASYDFFKHLFLVGGGDDLANKDRRSVFVGGGIKFEDDDLKYLLTSGLPKGN